jgi:hypothetical protein
MLLCDFAEALNGKLYVMGGGWTILWTPDQPANIALAIIVYVPWDRTNERFDVRAELLTSDGHAVEVENHEIALQGQFEIGRPPGVKPGTKLLVPLAFSVRGLPLPAGSFEWKLLIGGDPVVSCPFVVAQPPGMPT